MAVIGVVVAPLQAGAEIGTCGTKSNYWDGISAQPVSGAFEGASAMITNETSQVCDTDTSQDNYTLASTYFADYQVSSWVQSGFIRWYNAPTYGWFFGQVWDTYDNYKHTAYSGAAISGVETHHFWEEWRSSCSCVYALIDGDTGYAHTMENPNTKWTKTPLFAEWFGETTYLESDVPGYAATQTAFTQIRVQLKSDSSFSNNLQYTGSYNYNVPRWSQCAISGGTNENKSWCEWTSNSS